MTGQRPGRVLFVHAHPDDETIVTGALIRAWSDAGTVCDVVTLTRGERGECTPAAGGLDGEALLRHREAELARAIVVLGVQHHAWLGTPPARVAGLPARRYTDSGMEWIRPGLAGPAADVDAGALTRAPLDDAAADLRALVLAWQPELLVSYADDGGYGHPDHVYAHRLAAAVAAHESVEFAEVLTEPAADAAWAEYPQAEPALRRALGCYTSQLSVGPDGITHVGGQHEDLHLRVGLRRG